MQGFEDTLNIVEKDESKKETLKCIFFYVGLVVLEKKSSKWESRCTLI